MHYLIIKDVLFFNRCHFTSVFWNVWTWHTILFHFHTEYQPLLAEVHKLLYRRRKYLDNKVQVIFVFWPQFKSVLSLVQNPRNVTQFISKLKRALNSVHSLHWWILPTKPMYILMDVSKVRNHIWCMRHRWEITSIFR